MTVHTDAQLTNESFPPRNNTADRHRLAQFYVSGFPAQLALARWQYGGETPHLHPGVPALRAAFYAAARHDFQAWLECGGFHAADDQAADAPVSGHTFHPTTSQAVRDGDAQQVDACNRPFRANENDGRSRRFQFLKRNTTVRN